MKLYIILLISILAGCNYINTDQRRIDKVESIKIFFYDNKRAFERIVEQLNNDKKLSIRIGELINPDEFDELTNKQLRRLEIEHVSISKKNCEQLGIEFATSWTEYPIGKLYLVNDCSDDKSKKGNYWKGGFIEVWGLGDDWIIWIDSDPI